ncbi:uroporphyrinogen-III C-methyltransferase [Hwanghaeella grinnelliae]|uniref:uroporphyrinogen-III C-methyltransferase n=1 Tax=Hwanghaeella grinnelliae TaxID=2500179 RepID=A0A3S2VPS0_9PROT|nr:uroporphyrinogen-III C-methyltransferase [Hwanghaeella grinnelliae]RVU36096.1 uroporphyrinogen-III C-methyltransferase [Hwanghaeella grinnelliae]
MTSSLVLPSSLPVLEPGWVWLVGAGPGDPGLLTLHALNGLAQADTVVYDALVDDRILALAAPDAEMIHAGKRGGKPSPKQRAISNRLVDLARDGRKVVRLKGGDPFVFGRGGEEALDLVDAGIPFRVVPGITAGIGGLAYAGIPATHRDTNSAVTFVTGHGVTGDVPDGLNWQALAQGSPVLILYMALKHMGEITRRLIEGGRSPHEPTALVCSAATENQRVAVTTLADAPAIAETLDPPAIVVIGDVVRLRPALNWLGALTGTVLEADPLGNRSDREAG